jgi:hypothetical protein
VAACGPFPEEIMCKRCKGGSGLWVLGNGACESGGADWVSGYGSNGEATDNASAARVTPAGPINPVKEC